MNYSDNYLDISLIAYAPKLKMYRSILMLTQEQQNEVATDTNDSALRLYEYYIAKRGWKHFNPTAYEAIGIELGWTQSKTSKTKTMLVKAGYLVLKKDTLRDSTVVYRMLLGKELVSQYKLTGMYPSLSGTIDEL